MQGTDTMTMVSTFWPFVAMAAIFYFMLYRPQKKEQKRRDTMLNSLKKGDNIVTIGGIFGEIVKVGEAKITISIAENVNVDVIRGAIARMQEDGK